MRADKFPSNDGAIRQARGLLLPLGFAAALASLSLLPLVIHSSHLRWTFVTAATILGVWNGLLFANTFRQKRILSVDIVLRPQHYVQACAQGALLLYWGWYWREVYDAVHLLAAQLLFAYAFDALLSWTRRDTYTLGFSPFPVILSINLFLWFKTDWFYLQFLLIAVGFSAKELISWQKDNRRVHIFNPSSFALGLFSLALIATGTTDVTWGEEIATTLNRPPEIYLAIFLVSLPGQLLFGVTTMTISAVVTMYAFGLVYFALTGTYYFIDAYIPIAVFLGMHLLFTDPSTSPRTDCGRIIFGIVYALSIISLYGALGAFGVPRFYDKLLAVPIMNMLSQAIDRIARSNALRRFDPAALGQSFVGWQRNLAYIGLWTSVFIVMTTSQGIGDTHRGQWVTFWQQACAEDRPNGCRHFGVMVSTYCNNGSGWACNEYGILLQTQSRPNLSTDAFRRACDLGFSAGCSNLSGDQVNNPVRMAPGLTDYKIVLRQDKRPRPAPSQIQIYHLACAQGFVDGCRQECNLGVLQACVSTNQQ